MQKEREFTGLRAHFWPIKMADMKKIIPLFIIFTCLSSASSLINDFKIIVIGNYFTPINTIALQNTGTLPILVFIIPLYLAGIHYFSPKNFFHTVLNIFIIGIAISTGIIMGMPELFTQNPYITVILVTSFKLVTTVLCWTLITQIFSVQEYKRIFAIFFVLMNCPIIFISISSMAFALANKIQFFFIFAAGLCVTAKYAYHNLYTNILSFSERAEQETPISETISFWGSLKQAFMSPTLYLMLVMMVIFYSSSNMFDFLMNHFLKASIEASKEVNGLSRPVYNLAIGKVSIIIGITKIAFLLCVGIAMLYQKSWQFIARLIPLTIVIASLSMLALISCPEVLQYLSSILHKTQADIFFYGSSFCVVLIGFLSTLFLILKGQVYFYLGKDEQTKGRIVFEFIGTMVLGKELGNLISSSLMMSQNTSNFPDIATSILGTIFIFGIIMFGVVNMVSKRIQVVEHD